MLRPQRARLATTPSQHWRAKAKTKAEADIMIFCFFCVFFVFFRWFFTFFSHFLGGIEFAVDARCFENVPSASRYGDGPVRESQIFQKHDQQRRTVCGSAHLTKQFGRGMSSSKCCWCGWLTLTVDFLDTAYTPSNSNNVDSLKMWAELQTLTSGRLA